MMTSVTSFCPIISSYPVKVAKSKTDVSVMIGKVHSSLILDGVLVTVIAWGLLQDLEMKSLCRNPLKTEKTMGEQSGMLNGHERSEKQKKLWTTLNVCVII